ncbi:cell division protein FtsL, partial [Elioraea rosea]
MLRLATLFWLALAVAVGLLLYNVKHEVQGLEQHLARTNRAIAATHERIHVLHAEWSLLNEPDRLRALATRHLDLVPVRPAQLVQPQVIAALPEAQPHGTTALAEATPPPAAAAAPPAQPASTPRVAEEKPARIAPRREEPLPPP